MSRQATLQRRTHNAASLQSAPPLPDVNGGFPVSDVLLGCAFAHAGPATPRPLVARFPSSIFSSACEPGHKPELLEVQQEYGRRLSKKTEQW